MVFEKIKDFVEEKRETGGLFWKLLVLLKDIAWFLVEVAKGIVYVPLGLEDIISYFAHPPLIPQKNHIFLADSRCHEESKGGIFNPGALDFGKNIILLARSEKYPAKKILKKEEYYLNTCSPLLMTFNQDKKKDLQKIKINYQNKNPSRMEDFRLFKFKNKIYSNFSITIWPKGTSFKQLAKEQFKKRMLIGELDLKNKELNNIREIKTDIKLQNWEKNWVFFQKGKDLCLIYSFYPKFKLLKLTNQKNWTFKTIISKKKDLPIKTLNKKTLRLSTNPIEYDKNSFLILVHLRNKNLNKNYYQFWGVLIDKTSLLPIKITKKPLFKSPGSLWKSQKQIIYVSSVVKNGENFIFFMGKEDKKTFYSKLNKKVLESSWLNIP